MSVFQEQWQFLVYQGSTSEAPWDSTHSVEPSAEWGASWTSPPPTLLASYWLGFFIQNVGTRNTCRAWQNMYPSPRFTAQGGGWQIPLSLLSWKSLHPSALWWGCKSCIHPPLVVDFAAVLTAATACWQSCRNGLVSTKPNIFQHNF